MTSYYTDTGKFDKIRIVVEIGSLQDREPASMTMKNEVIKQLHDYMSLLGNEGASGRWDETVLGVAILGTEVSFSRPRKKKNTYRFTNPGKWYGLYDDKFVNEINRVADICRKDEKNEK